MADEIDNLLDQLESIDPTVQVETPPPPSHSELIDMVEAKTQIVKQEKQAASKPLVTLDITSIMQKHDKDYEETMTNLQKDRTKIDSLISKLMSRIDANSDRGADIESAVRACDVLVQSNLCIVRLMDARAKMVAAIKGHTPKVAAAGGGPSPQANGDLKQMLDQPEDNV